MLALPNNNGEDNLHTWIFDGGFPQGASCKIRNEHAYKPENFIGYAKIPVKDYAQLWIILVYGL